MKHSSLFCRVTMILLVFACLFTLPGCSKYRLEMSTSKESEIMMVVGETEVPFEVVYFFYNTYLDAYPQESHEQRMARVEDGICELYAIFELCTAYNIAPYGDQINEALNDVVKEMIDAFPTRRDYINRITEQHMTDAVSRLLLRSYLCKEQLLGKMEKVLEDDKTLQAFLLQEDVIRVLSLTLDFGNQTDAMHRRAEEIMTALSQAEDTDEAFLYIARRKATSENAHTYITLDQWYDLCGEDGPAPVYGTISGPLYENGVCLIMRVSEKDIDYAQKHRNEISISYLACVIKDQATTLATKIQKKEAYQTLTLESFS